MAVRIRLKRMGRTHSPFYRICAMDSRAPRDGRVIEELGTYDPADSTGTETVVLNKERAEYWLSVGAKPSETVLSILRKHDVAIPIKAKRKKRRKQPKES